MKKRNTFVVVALLLAVVVLGVGYAASTGPWVISGTAKASASTDFDVDFIGTPTVTDGVVASITNDVSATMEVTLSNVDDSGSATFTLTNNSPVGIGASFTADMVKIYKENGTDEWENSTSSEYFDIAVDTTGTGTIASNGGTATVKVTVTLKKAAVADITERFVVKVEGITATQE